MIIIQMTSRTGRPVANQFEISGPDARYFQSYRSIIVKIDRAGRVTLDRNTWDYSRTTAKYRNQFLGEDTKTTTAKIKSGEYALDELN